MLKELAGLWAGFQVLLSPCSVGRTMARTSPIWLPQSNDGVKCFNRYLFRVRSTAECSDWCTSQNANTISEPNKRDCGFALTSPDFAGAQLPPSLVHLLEWQLATCQDELSTIALLIIAVSVMWLLYPRE
jgi:hypothetical protein